MFHPDLLVWLVVWPPPTLLWWLDPAAEVMDCNGFTAVPLTGHCLNHRKNASLKVVLLQGDAQSQ